LKARKQSFISFKLGRLSVEHSEAGNNAAGIASYIRIKRLAHVRPLFPRKQLCGKNGELID
jgi:hypothetical protein